MAPESDENTPSAPPDGPDAPSYEDEPGGYARVEARADLDWGVQIRGGNERVVWTNGEGWTELTHALQQVRRYFPTLVIHVVTGPDSAPTVITPDQPIV